MVAPTRSGGPRGLCPNPTSMADLLTAGQLPSLGPATPGGCPPSEPQRAVGLPNSPGATPAAR